MLKIIDDKPIEEDYYNENYFSSEKEKTIENKELKTIQLSIPRKNDDINDINNYSLKANLNETKLKNIDQIKISGKLVEHIQLSLKSTSPKNSNLK